jgi:hypothetical protein
MSGTTVFTGVKVDGGGFLGLSGDDQWKMSVCFLLRSTRQSTTGSAILNAIAATGKSLVIRPFPDKSACNADAGPGSWEDATRKEHPVLPGSDDPKTPGDDRFKPVTEYSGVRRVLSLPEEPRIGTGIGSDCEIRFSPEMWGYGGSCGTGGQPGARPGEILFHEMVHAYRQMAGHSFSLPTIGTRRRYDNVEEFIAILLTNLFATDSTNHMASGKLRASHWGFDALAAPQAHQWSFNKANRTILDALLLEEPILVAAIKDAPCSFHPIKEYLLYRIALGTAPDALIPEEDAETARQAGALRGQAAPPKGAASHLVAPGETLSQIAKKQYHNPRKWPLIYIANIAVIGPEPDLVKPGQRLHIPQLR